MKRWVKCKQRGGQRVLEGSQLGGGAAWGSSLSALKKSRPLRISCPSLYWPRCFPLPLRVKCRRPGVCQEDRGLHFPTLQAPDWLPSWLLSPGLSLCESPAAAQRAGPVTCVPQTLLLSPGAWRWPCDHDPGPEEGRMQQAALVRHLRCPCPGAVCTYTL